MPASRCYYIVGVLAVVAASAWLPFAQAADPTCASGIRGDGTRACCAASCGVCGGTNCQDHPGGADACCVGAIERAGNSCDIHNPPCMVAPPAPTPAPPPASVVNPKRGFVADSKNCDDPVLMNTSGWFYSYNVDNPYRGTNATGDCALANATANLDGRFAPMNWCLSSLDRPVPAYVRRKFFMGFNEPNNAHNCDTDAATVAKAWGKVMAQWPDSLLVSPATAGNGVPFFDEFFGNCSLLYGGSGCNISHLAAHCYSCDPNSTLTYLKELHDRYELPVWLTEFSCGDHAQKRPTSDHVKFMRGVLPLLDAADFVYRYSWMSAEDPSGLRGLFETNAAGERVLTELGEIYNA